VGGEEAHGEGPLQPHATPHRRMVPDEPPFRWRGAAPRDLTEAARALRLTSASHRTAPRSRASGTRPRPSGESAQPPIAERPPDLEEDAATAGAISASASLESIRSDPLFSKHSAVWPFETGWAPPIASWLSRLRILHAEIYPSVRVPLSDAINDRGQVRAVWHWARNLDARDLLVHEFAMPADITSGSPDDIDPQRGRLDPGLSRSVGPPRGPEPRRCLHAGIERALNGVSHMENAGGAQAPSSRSRPASGARTPSRVLRPGPSPLWR
jgi:hypothetical protein